ncbi:MAG: hypothetical protein WED15_06625 [Akkermansiaceae bacterium]
MGLGDVLLEIHGFVEDPGDLDGVIAKAVEIDSLTKMIAVILHGLRNALGRISW